MFIVAAFSTILSGCSNTTTLNNGEHIAPPKMWNIQYSANKGNCVDVAGRYSMWGKGSPQSPKSFRGVPYSLDVMLGVDLSSEERQRVTEVKLEFFGQKEGLRLTFFSLTGIVAEKMIDPNERIIICKQDSLNITRKSVATKGEAARGTADILEKLFLGKDGSLIVNKVIQGKNAGLFYKRSKEEYWVRFERST